MLTWISLAVILAAFVYEVVLIRVWKASKALAEHKAMLDYFAPALSTLGVLGTFLGITIGLQDFNTQDLNHSIPTLLEGLKMAFYTSLLGMAGSLYISWRLNRLTDKQEQENPSNIDLAAQRICQAVASMSEQVAQTMQQLSASMVTMEQTVRQQNAQSTMFYGTALARMDKPLSALETALQPLGDLGAQLRLLTDSVQQLPVPMQAILTSLESIKPDIRLTSTGVSELPSHIDAARAAVEAQAGQLAAKADEQAEQAQALYAAVTTVNQSVEALTGKLHGEVVEIEEKMAETNRLMALKFDEFSELMRKNNTEALVEVMTAATCEFQQTMGELVKKLVQENFDRLNTTVERMNQWQQEHKEMVDALTAKYQAMDAAFRDTAAVFGQVAASSEALTGASGRLSQLVSALQKVMVDDARFTQMTANLTAAAEQARHTTDELHAHTVKLNEWVRGHHEIQEAVTLLVKKLEDLNAIRDYGETFWKDTKARLEEGVTLLTNASGELNRQLEGLDAHFYQRLSATLSNLDACISRMIEQGAGQNNGRR